MPVLNVEFYPKLPKSDDLHAVDVEIKENAKNWDKPFFFDPRKHFNMEEIKKQCDPILEKEIEHVIVIGTGGSIQTTLSLMPFFEREVHPIMSSRPTELKDLFRIPGIKKKSIVVPISRGGETLDVNSVLALFPRYNILGLSSRGRMNGILKTLQVPIMDVPDLSGRFAGSCTNVGLVPAYLGGINIEVFISGLEQGYELYNMNIPIETNSAKEFALYLYKLFKNGYRNVFSMPYFKWLEGVIGLWVQELSESTGKDGQGLLGTSQPAPLCQHSVLELLLGGPKFHSLPLLWTLEKDPNDMPLNSTIPHIQDKTAAQTIRYQAHATFEALLTKGIPAAMISLEIPTLRNIGHLIAFIQSTVYYLCLMFNVNWANNPNVLLGKEICNYAMDKNKSFIQMQTTRIEVAKEKFKDFWIL